MFKWRILDHASGEFVMNCNSETDAMSKLNSLNYKAETHGEYHEYDADYCDDGLTYRQWAEKCEEF